MMVSTSDLDRRGKPKEYLLKEMEKMHEANQDDKPKVEIKTEVKSKTKTKKTKAKE